MAAPLGRFQHRTAFLNLWRFLSPLKDSKDEYNWRKLKSRVNHIMERRDQPHLWFHMLGSCWRQANDTVTIIWADGTKKNKNKIRSSEHNNNIKQWPSEILNSATAHIITYFFTETRFIRNSIKLLMYLKCTRKHGTRRTCLNPENRLHSLDKQIDYCLGARDWKHWK